MIKELQKQLKDQVKAALEIPTAEAHCDIPCKIYDPAPAQIAALSACRMVDMMHELDGKGASLQNTNTMARYIREKEDQATICKEEIRVIWGDYFKKPQFDKHGEIHDLTHQIMMTSSKVKQEPTPEMARNLVELVNKFAEIFWDTKGVKTKRATCPYPPSLEVVYPDL